MRHVPFPENSSPAQMLKGLRDTAPQALATVAQAFAELNKSDFEPAEYVRLAQAGINQLMLAILYAAEYRGMVDGYGQGAQLVDTLQEEISDLKAQVADLMGIKPQPVGMMEEGMMNSADDAIPGPI